MKNHIQDELIKYFVFLFFVIFCLVQASILFDTHFLSGESSTLSNVPIEYFLNNKWHYPLHAHDLFYPGIDVFMLHPPLHYLLSSLWIDLFGIGTWQLLLQSAVSGTLGIAVTTFVLMRVSGANTAIFVPVLASISAAYLFCSTELRADLSFGFVHSLTVLVLGLLIFQKPSRDKQIFLSFLFGLLVLLALATHWFGFFTQLYLPCFVALMILKQKGSSIMLISSCFAGVAFGMTCWFWFFGEDLLLSFIAILFKGSDFLQTFTMGNKYYLSFLTEWPGGNILIIGLVLELSKAFLTGRELFFLEAPKAQVGWSQCLFWLTLLPMVCSLIFLSAIATRNILET